LETLPPEQEQPQPDLDKVLEPVLPVLDKALEI
jgi:hypothetical protein